MCILTQVGVYPADLVCDLADIPKRRCDPKLFGPAPLLPERGMWVFYPGLTLAEQLKVPIVERNRLLWVLPQILTSTWAQRAPEPGYRRVCLPAPGTDNLPVIEQEKLVESCTETSCPTAIATWAWLIHCLATDGRQPLANRQFLRTAEDFSDGRRVELFPNRGRIHVNAGNGNNAEPSVWLASLGCPEGVES